MSMVGLLRTLRSRARYPRSHVSRPDLIHPSARIRRSRISGDVRIDERAEVSDCHISGPVRIGRRSIMNGPNTDVYAFDSPVEIGKFVYVARSVAIQGFLHDVSRCTGYFILNHLFAQPFGHEIAAKGTVLIGNDVWIGTQSVILPGARISDGAVVAANAVVNGDVPAYAIVGGSPATVLRYRFDEATIGALLELRWWDWPEERILRNRPLFDGTLTWEKIRAVRE